MNTTLMIAVADLLGVVHSHLMDRAVDESQYSSNRFGG